MPQQLWFWRLGVSKDGHVTLFFVILCASNVVSPEATPKWLHVVNCCLPIIQPWSCTVPVTLAWLHLLNLLANIFPIRFTASTNPGFLENFHVRSVSWWLHVAGDGIFQRSPIWDSECQTYYSHVVPILWPSHSVKPQQSDKWWSNDGCWYWQLRSWSIFHNRIHSPWVLLYHCLWVHAEARYTPTWPPFTWETTVIWNLRKHPPTQVVM